MNEEIGEKIKRLRLENGMTLEELGNKVGVGKSTVRKWETGFIQNMRRDKISALANALGVTPEFLLGWEDKTKPERVEKEEIKFALFGGESATDEELEEVIQFVEFIKAKREKEKRK